MCAYVLYAENRESSIKARAADHNLRTGANTRRARDIEDAGDMREN